MNSNPLIRNFCIIAHIDHGKSTLADQLLLRTGTLSQREMREQVLDTMDLERERGITIKAQAVRMMYRARDGQTYELNMIDTPGHVDFSYEVSRSLAGCEGALLLVDAAQGVEAQTIANAYLAIDSNLEIIPVINKVDLPNADIPGVKSQIEEALGLDTETAILASAKTGAGVDEILEAIVARVPPPRPSGADTTRALIFDSAYDNFRGVVTYIRVFEGSIGLGDKVRFMKTGRDYDVTEVGYFSPRMVSTDRLHEGEVGYIIAAIKDISSVKVGDTITQAQRPAATALAGYRESKPFVFAGLFPTNTEQFEDLAVAIEKINLNDASFIAERENSEALGFGFRCGFLGMLHMEIIQERLEREHGLDLVLTCPNVGYRVTLSNGEVVHIDKPADLPDVTRIALTEEPYIEGRFLLPADYVGALMTLAQAKRGIQKGMQYLGTSRVMLTYELPLSEIIFDFYDKLKSATRGYASFDYEIIGYRPVNMVKLDILINGDPVDALSTLVRREDAQWRGRQLCEKLRQIVPRQQYEVAIQAAIGGKIIARETVKALRKNVTAKCYGGDITRKRKLLEKQKAGKKRMRQIGRVEIPQEAFMAVLRTDEG
ncbi:MAG TPA: translation elongation factor 4 [Candidatus Sumerlaeota bacterium]|nr:MAG: Elongation factor 4 [candidate division BRC1 bacterium ADurb.BinA292]HOE96389.1 translation elongation factor 4 [Candidatus Sumerlaeota bacterium]HOR27944.1 translation elongation factor 4 [Candidatus Sumerlaeota bacterium]HPK01620.1 translation elongation factor 4 [Candidatus Sumerlaeota bacterium]